jgi:hypothetical protein
VGGIIIALSVEYKQLHPALIPIQASIFAIATMRAVLFSLSAFAFYAIFYFSQVNGLNELGLKSVASGKLPGLDEPLRTVYTGVEPVDRILTVLTTFFYPVLDGQSSALLLHGIGFSGTFGAAWTLVVLESWRKGNAGTVAA